MVAGKIVEANRQLVGVNVAKAIREVQAVQ
jgi:hypothetical protein